MSTRHTSADGRFRRVSPAERRGLPHGRWIATLAVTVLLSLVAVFGSGGWMVARREAAAVRALNAELAAVEAEQAAVDERTRALLRTGGFELERVAREEYLMRAAGDEVIHLVPDEAPAAGDGPPPVP